MALRESSPHTVLGLRAGATRAEIDAAYRALIKQHHPDRHGGDTAEAARVNRAYRDLLSRRGGEAVEVRAPPLPAGAPRPWKRPLALAGLLVAAWAAPWPGAWQPAWPTATPPAAPRPATGEEGAESPVPAALVARINPDLAAVDAAIDEARRLQAAGSAAPSITYGRSCAQDLTRLPGEGLLDHCVAFDVAAAKGPAGNDAWLGVETMAARHAAAATGVLGDPVLAEARVREIRRLVERRLIETPR